MQLGAVTLPAKNIPSYLHNKIPASSIGKPSSSKLDSYTATHHEDREETRCGATGVPIHRDVAKAIRRLQCAVNLPDASQQNTPGISCSPVLGSPRFSPLGWHPYKLPLTTTSQPNQGFFVVLSFLGHQVGCALGFRLLFVWQN